MNNQEVTRITSFSINHDKLLPGLYVSRVDGDVTTYDMRTRRPNTGDLMDNSTMHSLEHMFATYIRNGSLKDSVIYFGPMGCQTGFYALTLGVEPEEFAALLEATFRDILEAVAVPAANEVQCGWGANHSLVQAQEAVRAFLAERDQWDVVVPDDPTPAA